MDQKNVYFATHKTSGNGANKGSKVTTYTSQWVSDGCDQTLVFPIPNILPMAYYTFLTYVAIQLIWAYFDWNQTILKN